MISAAIHKAIHHALSGAILHLNHAHRILIKAELFEVADAVEDSVEAIRKADARLKQTRSPAAVQA